MGIDSLLKKMKMVSEDEYDTDFDGYDEFDDDEEEEPVVKKSKKAKKTEIFPAFDEMPEDEEEGSPYAASVKKTEKKSSYSNSQSGNIVGMRNAKGNTPEVCMIMPKSYEDANTIADVLLSHKAVVLNLEGIDMAAAQRLIDFASGSCYTVGGNLQKISKKIFIVVPQDMNLSGDFDDLLGDMIDLNSVNMMK